MSQCPRPPSFSNGKLIIQGTFYGNEIQYRCNSGYTLVGEYKRRCQKDKTWSGVAPLCKVVVCGEPPKIEGGRATSSYTRAGDSVIYICLPGYSLTQVRYQVTRQARCRARHSLPRVKANRTKNCFINWCLFNQKNSQ